METTSFEDRPLKERIANWLAVTQELDVPAGLDEEESLARARELWRLIREGKISPAEVELDEDFKDVISALVRLIWDSKAPADVVVHEADAVYQFIRRLSWPRGPFDEQRDLLLECATAGWGALGYTPSDIAQLRRDARIPRFPGRRRPMLSPEDAREAARGYLDKPPADRSGQLIHECLSAPEVFLAICNLLKDRADVSPSTVAEEGSKLYAWVTEFSGSVGLFDERHYFLGESALLAAGACRLLGKREEAELWLDRSEAGFRHTVNPAPLLARVAYARLSLHHDRRQYQRVFELLPSLISSFQKLNMQREVLKCRFLGAMTLKELARREEAREHLEDLRTDPALKNEPALQGLVLVNLGELLAANGLHLEAVSVYQDALAAQGNSDQPLVRAHLKVAIGEGLRDQGQLAQAVESYRSAISDYAALSMSTWVAYVRVVVAETLVALSRNREAEWEILAALPTIEEQKMVPEGFAAVALLRESVRRRQTDQNALRELREHLQAKSKS